MTGGDTEGHAAHQEHESPAMHHEQMHSGHENHGTAMTGMRHEHDAMPHMDHGDREGVATHRQQMAAMSMATWHGRHGHGRHGHGRRGHGRHGHGQHGHGRTAMGGMDMSMVTPVRPVAAWLAIAVGSVLVGMLLLRPAWRVVEAFPDPDSARRVGHLLMAKYMIGFEGAGFLILIGIFGAVLLARPSSYPDDRRAAPSRHRPEARADRGRRARCARRRGQPFRTPR